MGGCRCVYRNCESSTTTTPGLHYFHFPVRDPDRCEQWLINARKPVLRAMPKEKLRNKVVCSLHFERQCFTNEKHDRLIHNAVPTLGCEDCPDYEEEPPATNDSPDNNIMLIPVSEDNTKFTLPDVEFPGMTYTIYDDAVIPTSSLPTTQESKISILVNKPKRPKFMVTSINKIIPSATNEDSTSSNNVISYCVSTCGDDVTLQPSTQAQEEDVEMCSYTMETESKSDAPLLDNEVSLKPKRNNEYTMSVITTPITNFNNIQKHETSKVLVKEVTTVDVKNETLDEKWNSLQKSSEIETRSKKKYEKNDTNIIDQKTTKATQSYMTYEDQEKNFVIQIPQNEKDESEFKSMPESEYKKLINNNTKQIRALKRLINKQNKMQRFHLQQKQLLKYRKKPNKNLLLSQLKSLVQPSVMAILKFELLPSNDIVLTDEEEKFLLDLYNDHPELYKVLLKEYNWKLPGYESFHAE